MKIWKRSSIFVSMFLFVYIALCFILTPKTRNDKGGNKFYAGRGFEAEAEDTIEVVGLGNSDLYSGINPLGLYRRYKITSYSCGIAKCSTAASYRLLRDILKKHQIKICVIETDFLYNKLGLAEYIQAFAKLQFLVAPFIYHSRWKNLKWKDFTKLPNLNDNYDPFKGFMYSSKVFDYKLTDYMGNINDEALPIPSENVKYLDKIRKLCEKENIKIIFIGLPSPSSWSYAKSYGVKKYADKYCIDFIDYNINPELIDFDFNKDFRDKGNHLNIYGSIKVAKHLGQILLDYKVLTIHQNNNHFWQTELKMYEDRLKQDGIQVENIVFNNY